MYTRVYHLNCTHVCNTQTTVTEYSKKVECFEQEQLHRSDSGGDADQSAWQKSYDFMTSLIEHQ